MTPIAISNTRPGFVPFSARPLAIAGMTPKPPIRPAYRPAPYRPPMLSNPPRVEMGQGFKFSEIPLSLTLGVSGAAALVLASVIPTPDTAQPVVQFVMFRTNGPVWSLAVCTLIVPLLDRWLPGPRHQWKPINATAGANERGVPHETPVPVPGAAAALRHALARLRP